MATDTGSTLQRGLSVLGKLFAGTRKGPSGQRVRRLRKLQKRIGVRFTDLSLLEQALTHRSYSHVTSQTRNDSNERMEFLGDSVLGLSVSQFLYLEFPDRSEGALSKMKSLLVSRKVLSSVSRNVGLGEFLLLSGEESDMGGRDRTSILADSFEGVIGAIYLDQGYRSANKFIRRFLLADINEILRDEEHTNYKSLLQEYVQSRRLNHPVYRVRKEEGPEHEKEFAVDVVVRGEVWGSGRGKSKKDAEQNAARSALQNRQGSAPSQGARGRPRRAERAGDERGSRNGRGRGERAAEARGSTARRGAGVPAETAGERSRGGRGVAASRERLRAQRRKEAQEQARAELAAREKRRTSRRRDGPGRASRPAGDPPAEATGDKPPGGVRRGRRRRPESRGAKAGGARSSGARKRGRSSPADRPEGSRGPDESPAPSPREEAPPPVTGRFGGTGAEGEAADRVPREPEREPQREHEREGERRPERVPPSPTEGDSFARRKRRTTRGFRRR